MAERATAEPLFGSEQVAVVVDVVPHEAEIAEALEPTREAPPHDAAREAMRAMRWPSDVLAVHERRCVQEYMVVDNAELNVEGYTDYRFDGAGRVERQYWNSDAVALSGEILHRYDASGERARTHEIPYESIEGGRPRRPAPIAYRYEREGDAVTMIVMRGRQTLRTERFRFDAAGRVIEHVVDAGDSEDSGRVECTYDERGRPSARVRHRGERVVRQEYVYEDDRLVEVRLSIGSDARLVNSVWSVEGGFARYDGESIQRYRGRCNEVFFQDCSAALAPAPVAGGTRAALPEIRFGRPFEPPR